MLFYYGFKARDNFKKGVSDIKKKKKNKAKEDDGQEIVQEIIIPGENTAELNLNL
jgi:hypothetical protein